MIVTKTHGTAEWHKKLQRVGNVFRVSPGERLLDLRPVCRLADHMFPVCRVACAVLSGMCLVASVSSWQDPRLQATPCRPAYILIVSNNFLNFAPQNCWLCLYSKSSTHIRSNGNHACTQTPATKKKQFHKHMHSVRRKTPEPSACCNTRRDITQCLSLKMPHNCAFAEYHRDN